MASTSASTGSVVSYVPIRTRMIMSEKPNDGTVAMYYGDIENNEFLAAEDYLPTLPNTVSVSHILFKVIHLRIISLGPSPVCWAEIMK